jgi:hypothetical protein
MRCEMRWEPTLECEWSSRAQEGRQKESARGRRGLAGRGEFSEHAALVTDGSRSGLDPRALFSEHAALVTIRFLISGAAVRSRRESRADLDTVRSSTPIALALPALPAPSFP